jgi:hypothetical protein
MGKTWSLIWWVMFVYRCLSFVLCLLAIVLSVLIFTDSEYPFGFFKLFFIYSQQQISQIIIQRYVYVTNMSRNNLTELIRIPVNILWWIIYEKSGDRVIDSAILTCNGSNKYLSKHLWVIRLNQWISDTSFSRPHGVYISISIH